MYNHLLEWKEAIGHARERARTYDKKAARRGSPEETAQAWREAANAINRAIHLEHLILPADRM